MPYLTQKELEELPDDTDLWVYSENYKKIYTLPKRLILGHFSSNTFHLTKEAAEEQLKYEQVLKKLGAQNNTADNKVSWHNPPQILASDNNCTYIVEIEPE